MQKMRVYGALALVALAGAVACDRPGDADAAGGPAGAEGMLPAGMDPGVMAAMMEMQEIQQRLEPLQQEALQDDALAGQLAALSARIEAAMREEDAELVGRIERFQDEVEAAEASGDQARVQAMMMEAQTLQVAVQTLQASVLDRPDIRQDVEAFEAAHRARMVELDPEAGALLDRAEELVAQFRP
jgi:hypothetical protein